MAQVSGGPVKIEDARRIWYARQGLADGRKRTPAKAMAETGWFRTFGGNAYVSGFARGFGAKRRSFDAAVFGSGEIVNVPAVRACIMLAPTEDVPIALGAKVRSFGEPGKKLGESSNLSMTLKLISARGAIQRLPIEGRLDSSRLHYAKSARGSRTTGSARSSPRTTRARTASTSP